MQRTYTRKRRRRGPWAGYNSWRANNRELDNARRRERAAERKAGRDAKLNTRAESLALIPQPKRARTKPALRLQIRIAIESPAERHTRTITATYSPLFQRWSIPQRKILAGLSALLTNAPIIAGIKAPSPAAQRAA